MVPVYSENHISCGESAESFNFERGVHIAILCLNHLRGYGTPRVATLTEESHICSTNLRYGDFGYRRMLKVESNHPLMIA
jgi:hypothetical protein